MSLLENLFQEQRSTRADGVCFPLSWGWLEHPTLTPTHSDPQRGRQWGGALCSSTCHLPDTHTGTASNGMQVADKRIPGEQVGEAETGEWAPLISHRLSGSLRTWRKLGTLRQNWKFLLPKSLLACYTWNPFLPIQGSAEAEDEQ